MASGIYIITNKINNKIYIGSSNDIKKRWYEHKSTLNRNIHKNQHLQSAWNKYGKDNFKFEIFIKCPVDQLKEIEQRHLNLAKELPDLYYNISYDAESPVRGRKGLYRHSEEAKLKMSLIHKGKNNYCFDYNIYKFQNIITDETFEGTQYDFRIKYNLNKGHICNLIQRKLKQHKGWILL